jgi:serine/threonine protein kinase
MAELDLSKKVADRYLKREVLGEGTYGVVYKAIDTKVILSLLCFFFFFFFTNLLFGLENLGFGNSLRRRISVKLCLVAEKKREILGFQSFTPILLFGC